MSYKEKTALEEKKPVRIISDDQINRFGERLKIAMNGMSNNAFAKLCGWSEKVIRNYLNGESYPSLDRLVVIANVSGCSIGWLASGFSDDESDNLTSENLARSAGSHATPEQQQVWKEILDRMTPDEREAVITSVFRHGVSALIQPTLATKQSAPSKLPLPDSLPERLGISHDALAMGMLYDSLPNKDRQKILADIAMQQLLASGHEPSDKQAG